MKSRTLFTAFAMLLTSILVAPSIFLTAPQPVRAQEAVEEVGPNLLTNIKTTGESTLDVFENTVTAVSAPLTAAATTLSQINSYVLQPLAYVLSGNLLKWMNFVTPFWSQHKGPRSNVFPP